MDQGGPVIGGFLMMIGIVAGSWEFFLLGICTAGVLGALMSRDSGMEAVYPYVPDEPHFPPRDIPEFDFWFDDENWD